MMKTIFSIALFFLIISFNRVEIKSDNSVITAQKVDTIYYKHSEYGIDLKLALLTNGKFIYEYYSMNCFGGNDRRKKVFGKYAIRENNLSLNPEKVKLFIYPKQFDLEPKVHNWNYINDTLKIKTSYNIVKWGKTKYLLSEYYDAVWNSEKQNDYIRFANEYNSGIEPIYHGYYLVNENEGNKNTKLDLNQIPEKWRKYFLVNPISAKIISITKSYRPNMKPKSIMWTLVINKGKNDGVRKGMTFESKQEDFSFEVDSVFNNKSMGKTYYYEFDEKKYPKGTEFRTKWN
jgi:hypothetical protein